MGLFDRLLNCSDSLTPQAGLLLPTITMVAADGDVDDDEMAIIRRLDGGQRTTDWDSAGATSKEKTVQECISLAAASMNDDQRVVAMANLIDIAMADGTLAGAEKGLVEEYVGAFNVDISKVEEIVSVTSLKNNKEVFGC